MDVFVALVLNALGQFSDQYPVNILRVQRSRFPAIIRLLRDCIVVSGTRGLLATDAADCRSG
jgi:hypothetical protein